jgi:hypothetical protein
VKVPFSPQTVHFNGKVLGQNQDDSMANTETV